MVPVLVGGFVGVIGAVLASVVLNLGGAAFTSDGRHVSTGGTSDGTVGVGVGPVRNICPNRLVAPGVTRATTFPIEVDVTCKVASGNSLYLVSEIANADGRGTTEYYLLTSWNISTTETAPQYWSVKAAPNTVRKYFLISVSPEQLAKIRTSGNAAADGGYLSLMSAVVVSNTQTTQTR